MSDALPTPHQVGLALVAACRETGADPQLCAQGEVNPADGMYAYSRARVYAGLAIEALFDCGATAISKMVGYGSSSLLANTRFQLRNGTMTWYSDAALERVKSAIRTGGGSMPIIDVAIAQSTPVASDRRCACGAPMSAGAQAQCRKCYLKSHKARPKPKCCVCGAPCLGRHAHAKCRDCYRSTAKTPMVVAGTKTREVVFFQTEPGVVAVHAAAEARRVVARLNKFTEATRDAFRSPLVLRKTAAPASQCEDLTPGLMGDPPRARSALASATPWVPYEARGIVSEKAF